MGTIEFIAERDYWRARAERAEADVARLVADRAAMLNLWIVRNGNVWQIPTEAVAPPTYPTRAEAEEAMLAWAHSRKEKP